jgi:hypothetical protein
MSLNCGFALWRGGIPERATAGAFLAAWLISRLVYDYGDWVDPQWGVLAVDAALLGVLVWLALATDRTWLLFAAAFQLIAVIIHIAIMADHRLRALTYVRGLVIWSYLTQAALSVGVIGHLRARGRQTAAMAPARR